MTEQMPVTEEQSGVVIKEKINNTKRPTLWPLYILILLMAMGMGMGGTWIWYQHSTDLAALQEKLSELPKPAFSKPAAGVTNIAIAVIESELKSLREQLTLSYTEQSSLNTEVAVKALAMQVASIKSQLQSQTDTNRDDWKLAEAEFLLHLASQRALLAHNSHEALTLTQTVDEILRERGDPQLFAVRQVLADEISALKNIKPVDTEGVYLRLQALKNAVGKLSLVKPFERAVIHDKTVTVVDSTIDAMSTWGKVRASVKHAIEILSTYVRVREHEAVVEPLLAPEYTHFLQQNLMLMLEQAQSALLREESKIYQASLTKAEAWITQYFTSNLKAENVRRELNALKEIQLNINLPDISKALRLLKIYINDVHNIANNTPVIETSEIIGETQ